MFLAILDAGGLARAARMLRRSPASVTRSLAALEARAGARLAERTTRKLAPTEAGRRLADQARRVLADYETAVSVEASGPLRGRLALTAPLVFGRRHVSALVARFLVLHPGVSAELRLNDRNLDMIDEQLDVAVRVGALPDSSLVARKVGEVRSIVVAAPAYLERRGAPRTPEDLKTHEVITGVVRADALEWRFRSAEGREKLTRMTSRFTLTDVDAALNAVREGHGITRALSYQVADDLAAGRLVRLLAAWEPAALPVQLVTPTARLIPARVRAFLDHAAAELVALPVLAPAPK